LVLDNVDLVLRDSMETEYLVSTLACVEITMAAVTKWLSVGRLQASSADLVNVPVAIPEMELVPWVAYLPVHPDL